MEPDQSQALEWPRKCELKRFKKCKREPAWELEEDLSKDQELEPSGKPNMRVSSSCNYHPRGATTKEVLGAITGKSLHVHHTENMIIHLDLKMASLPHEHSNRGGGGYAEEVEARMRA
ncbi:hypothetical protein MHYP_G00102510 [Metynnis hypsauchen]